MEVSLQSFKKRFTYDPQKDLLGKGGFGEVYKAYDTEDHIFVALKISQGTTDEKYNLISEIKRFKKLNHPNIVNHIEAYEVNTGSSDIHGKPIAYHVGILEYANNGTLADLLKKERPDYRLIEDLAKDIIEGLAYLHNENIIHRDLKPTNILLFSEGEKLRAKITDFGIAKRTDATAASTQLVGTVEYMAPEFFSTGNITPAADVWSVGVLLLEAITGTHPFGKTTQGLSNEQIINNILNKDLSTATQNLHAPFKQIITRCLLRETNIRPQSATELKGLLLQGGDAFSERTQVITRPKNIVKLPAKSRKRKLIVAIIFLFFVLSIGILGWLISSGKIGFNNKPAESRDYILQNSQPTTLDTVRIINSSAPSKSTEIIGETPKQNLDEVPKNEKNGVVASDKVSPANPKRELDYSLERAFDIISKHLPCSTFHYHGGGYSIDESATVEGNSIFVIEHHETQPARSIEIPLNTIKKITITVYDDPYAEEIANNERKDIWVTVFTSNSKSTITVIHVCDVSGKDFNFLKKCFQFFSSKAYDSRYN